MEVMFEWVAGLDVGEAAVTVCVRTPSTRAGRRRSATRTFPTMSRSLGVMRDWLVAEGVSIAAIESTSTYCKPPLYCLEEVMDVWLLNAQHMKAVPGRKTDVRDAAWIAQLLEHGLLGPSFVPPPPIRCVPGRRQRREQASVAAPFRSLRQPRLRETAHVPFDGQAETDRLQGAVRRHDQALLDELVSERFVLVSARSLHRLDKGGRDRLSLQVEGNSFVVSVRRWIDMGSVAVPGVNQRGQGEARDP
jgi:hypothetical protein